jgi:hypothetical protein
MKHCKKLLINISEMCEIISVDEENTKTPSALQYGIVKFDNCKLKDDAIILHTTSNYIIFCTYENCANYRYQLKNKAWLENYKFKDLSNTLVLNLQFDIINIISSYLEHYCLNFKEFKIGLDTTYGRPLPEKYKDALEGIGFDFIPDKTCLGHASCIIEEIEKFDGVKLRFLTND